MKFKTIMIIFNNVNFKITYKIIKIVKLKSINRKLLIKIFLKMMKMMKHNLTKLKKLLSKLFNLSTIKK